MKSPLLLIGLAIVLAAAAPAAALTRRHTPPGTRLAAQSLLRRSDLGRGWSASAPPKSVLALSCPRFHPPTRGVIEVGAAVSPFFQFGSGGPFVSEQAYAYATAAQEASFWHRVAEPALVRCVEAALVRGSGGSVHFSVSAGGPLPLPAVGTRAHGYRVRGTANRPNQSVDVYVDLILLARGRTVAALNVSSFQQPPARRLEARLARTIARRLSAR